MARDIVTCEVAGVRTVRAGEGTKEVKASASGIETAEGVTGRAVKLSALLVQNREGGSRFAPHSTQNRGASNDTCGSSCVESHAGQRTVN